MGVSVFPRNMHEAVVITWTRVGAILRAVFGGVSVPEDVDQGMDFIIKEFKMKWIYIFHNILSMDKGYDKRVYSNVMSLVRLIASPQQMETIRKHSEAIMREVDQLFDPLDVSRKEEDCSGTLWLPEVKPELIHAFFVMGFGAHILSRNEWYFNSSKVYWRNNPEEYAQFLACVAKAMQFEFRNEDRFSQRARFMLSETAKFLTNGPNNSELTKAQLDALNNTLSDKGFNERCVLPQITNHCPWNIKGAWCVVHDARTDIHIVTKVMVNPENSWIIESSRRLILDDAVERLVSKAERKKIQKKASQAAPAEEEDD
jgi:hypothetical protein